MLDPHLHADALKARDLEDLRFFGVKGVLAVSDDAVTPPTADAIRAQWERVAGPVLRRLRKAGLQAWAAVGLHPRRIPWRGLEGLLTGLPEVLSSPAVVALGEIGLEEGSEREEAVFVRQLALAADLRLPVLVHTPERDKVKVTRQILALLVESGLPPERVLVDHADGRTVKMIRGYGFRAGLTLSTYGKDGVPAAARLVAALGPEGLVLDSDGGDGSADLLALPRAADRMRKLGLSEAVVARVCGGNAAELLGVKLEAKRQPAAAPAR